MPALTPFINKLLEIIDTATEEDCIKWGSKGDTIVVTDATKFAANVLPRYFKHDNIRSFIRQLNMYGFQRCRSSQAAGDSGAGLEFYHEAFVEGRRDLMLQITRGVASQKRHVSITQAPPHAFATDASSLLHEMRYVQQNLVGVDDQMRSQISSVNAKMTALSEALGMTLAQQEQTATAAAAQQHAEAAQQAVQQRAAGVCLDYPQAWASAQLQGPAAAEPNASAAALMHPAVHPGVGYFPNPGAY